MSDRQIKKSFKKWLPRTLFARSLMILVIPILLIQLTTTYIFFERHWTKMTDRLAIGVAGEIAWISDVIENSDGDAGIQALSRYAAQHMDLLISYDVEGVYEDVPNDNLKSNRFFLSETLSEVITHKVRRSHDIKVDFEEKWVEITLALEPGVLHVSVPQRRLFSSSGYIFLLWMTSVSIILLGIAILFMRNQIRPIRRLAIVAERFGKGRGIPSSFKPEGAREVRQAAQSFMDMHERIRRQIQQRTAMLSGVSHDLRTPLTRMKLQLAMMESSTDVEALKNDLADMERMLGAYLDFARGEGGEPASLVNMGEMLDRVSMKLKRQGMEVHTELDGDLGIHIRPVAMERCLMNVLNNASKFADTIWISAVKQDDSVEIKIDDNGPGIEEDQFEEVFKPFFTGEKSRNLETSGVGLGLSITQDIVLSHGGTIELGKSPHGGLRVEIILPT